jgi:preprotein translocase subunit YajC
MGNTSTTQPAAGATGAPPVAANPIMSFMPMIVVCLILYFLIIRPQQKQTKEHRRLIDSLKVGDRVLTQGGIYGTVTSLKGLVVQVKVADNVKIDVARSAISQVLTETTNGAATTVEERKA